MHVKITLTMKKIFNLVVSLSFVALIVSCQTHDMEDYSAMTLDRMSQEYLAGSTWDISSSELDDGTIKKGKHMVFATDTLANTTYTPQKDRCDVVKYALGAFGNDMRPLSIGIRDTLKNTGENSERQVVIRYYDGILRDMSVSGGVATVSFEILKAPDSERAAQGQGSVIVIKKRK